jgi:hypothetical protein
VASALPQLEVTEGLRVTRQFDARDVGQRRLLRSAQRLVEPAKGHQRGGETGDNRHTGD